MIKSLCDNQDTTDAVSADGCQSQYSPSIVALAVRLTILVISTTSEHRIAVCGSKQHPSLWKGGNFGERQRPNEEASLHHCLCCVPPGPQSLNRRVRWTQQCHR